MASIGQASALIVAHFILRMQIPIVGCALCIAASVLLNVVLRARFPVSLRLNDAWATSISGVRYRPTLRVAVFDRWPRKSIFDAISCAGYNFSGFVAMATNVNVARACPIFRDAPVVFAIAACWGPQVTAVEPPQLYTVGLWAAISVSVIFVSIYGNRVADEARQLASALTATELMLARAQHLSQLDGLAAAAAHELGTPLATVALVVHELADQPQLSDNWADDLRLVEDQVARCRNIIAKLSAPS